MSAKTSHVDALIAEVEAAQAEPKTMETPDMKALPPGTEELFLQIFMFLLNWWKSRQAT